MLPNPLETADLVTFTEEILNGKLHFLCTMFHCHKIFILLKACFFIIRHFEAEGLISYFFSVEH